MKVATKSRLTDILISGDFSDDLRDKLERTIRSSGLAYNIHFTDDPNLARDSIKENEYLMVIVCGDFGCNSTKVEEKTTHEEKAVEKHLGLINEDNHEYQVMSPDRKGYELAATIIGAIGNRTINIPNLFFYDEHYLDSHRLDKIGFNGHRHNNFDSLVRGIRNILFTYKTREARKTMEDLRRKYRERRAEKVSASQARNVVPIDSGIEEGMWQRVALMRINC